MNTEPGATGTPDNRWHHDLGDLLHWLEAQKGGIATFYEFQVRSLALRQQHEDHAGLLRLMADLAGRFADLFDGQPLDLVTANGALELLTAYLREAMDLKSGQAEEMVRLMNRIGLAELAAAD